MKKIVLVDGNNLMYRSYFATAYTGALMKNSKGLVTNALYGFANMINKIIDDEKPEYIAVAFDIGKSFRHRKYKEYKAGRHETPEDLLKQMPLAREMLEHMGITHLEVEDYEADDIIGTLCKRADLDPEWDATLITSDHDYLQLISDVVDVKLLQSKGFTRYKPDNFKEEYGIEPIKVIDLKALMGDPSDNIPGVPGVGEKTALKLLVEYGDLDNLYANVDSIKGKLKEKLVDNKESAYFSKELATIYCDVPLDIEFKDMLYKAPKDSLQDFYRELEFYSLMDSSLKKKVELKVDYKLFENVNEIDATGPIAYYIECDKENYHVASILGMGVFDGHTNFFVTPERIKEVMAYLKDTIKYTFDLKKNINLLNEFSLNTIYDMNLAAYLLNKTTKDDIAVLMNNDHIAVDLYHAMLKSKEDIRPIIAKKAQYIYEKHDKYIEELHEEEMMELFENIEMPLVTVLAKMEQNGIICDMRILSNLQLETKERIDTLSKEICTLCGREFNIASPRQLSEVLFEDLGLPHGKKKGVNGYKTGAEVLEKLINLHPAIPKILEFRNLSKINNTYLEGLKKYIMPDGKIHTIYKQTLTRTGRLSSVDPNLQNIPARDELGRLVRKAFIPENEEFLSADYSQIELRILAHISKSEELIQAYINGEDIHTKVAADIFNKRAEEVTKKERGMAKAVIFGIVYGISGFGLGENIGVTAKEANAFIDKYYELYPGVKEYMDSIVKEAYDKGYVRTLFHRKRNIEELFNPNYMIRQSGERIALNTPIQGTSADIIKKAMVEIDKAFTEKNIKSKMLLQIHDELVFDIIEEEKELVRDIVKNIMESTVDISVPLSVSTDFGKDLYETK